MAIKVNMPRLSDTMEEGTVAQWFKKVGDNVNEGDILAEIETDKATMEFESFNEGVLLHIGIETGESAPVDSLLAVIGEKGEDITDILNLSGTEEASTGEVSEGNKKDDQTTKHSPDVPMPDGAQIITMPRLSDTMEEGTVATWLKKVGDSIKEGDILAEIETDKATMEFESFYAGTLLHVGINEGESAPVDSILAVIGEPGTSVDQVLALFKSKNELPSMVAEEPTSKSFAVSAPPLSEKPSVTSKTEMSKPIVSIASANNGRVVASPLAKKLAAEKGFNLSLIQGTGEQGRIIKRDIYNYRPTDSIQAQPFLTSGTESVTEIANSQMRKTIAKRLAESKFSAPHYYLGVEFDMDNAISFRNQYNSLPNTKISFNDIVVKAVAIALKYHPKVNAKWEEHQITQYHHVHVGVAVAVEDGLVVPVVKFTDEQSLTQIGAAVKDYALRARDKKLKPDEMDGSTFTISNLGMFGIQEFTSIINQPNGAILSVGAIVQKPVVKERAIVVGNTMKLTLACDHRVVDGATGSLFLETLKEYVENPIKLLL
tara:strand:+ start:1690 stop:3321 length:1632 start_codon:yes stop_codon:yes gene_type:complete